MNRRIIAFILGQVLRIEGILLFIPAVTSLIYREGEGLRFLAVAAACLILGFILAFKKPESTVFYLKEGCIITALSWIVLSIFGCLPFVLTGEIPNFIDALFETISGFTTTGASILNDVEALSHCSLLWRSFTHWIGGMGVLVFLLAVIPMSGGSNINLMRAESPGPSVGKLVPKIRYTARILYLIYLGLTVIMILLLLAGGMPLFDSVCTAFGTAGTGGFGILNDSFTSYAPHLQWIVTIFMLLFGVNFNAYYLILLKQFTNAFSMEEVRAYIGTVLVAGGLIFANVLFYYKNAFEALTHTFFQVATVITTTGFSTTDFDQWPAFSKTILVILMFIGACAGSTGGGIKVSRFLIALKTFLKEVGSYIHPKSIKVVKMDGKPVEHEVVRSVQAYFITFLLIFTGSVLIISLDENDLVTNFTAVAATINNIGPGLSMVGPTCNFSFFSPISKIVLMFDMLAGRLELFPMLMLFAPPLWAEMMRGRKNKKKDSVKKSF